MELVKWICLAAAVLLAIRLLSLPIRWIFRLLLNAAGGFVLLLLFNTVGAFVGLSLGINLVTVLVTGLLGLPGLAVLLLARWILLV